MDDAAIEHLMQTLGIPTSDEDFVARSNLRSRHIPKFVREKVHARDGDRCRYCGSAENLEIDHIRLHSSGGSNAGNNLQTLCRTCNRRRYHDRSSIWAAFMQEQDFNPEDAALERLMRELNL
jgi:5-methylcytosine-specific restriction protein A